MYEIREAKKNARIECKAVRSSIDPIIKKELDNKICDIFCSLASYRYAETILAYYPIGDEIDVLPVITRALEQGKRVALPYCRPEGSIMNFFYIDSLENLSVGKYGIPSPDSNGEMYIPEKKKSEVVMMVPALAYDKNGYRLGYGKGYYDRYIFSFGGTLAGFTYSELLLDSVPRGRYDMSVDYIVTDKGVKIIEKA